MAGGSMEYAKLVLQRAAEMADSASRHSGEVGNGVQVVRTSLIAASTVTLEQLGILTTVLVDIDDHVALVAEATQAAHVSAPGQANSHMTLARNEFTDLRTALSRVQRGLEEGIQLLNAVNDNADRGGIHMRNASALYRRYRASF